LSRARGAKAQKRQQQYQTQMHQENTIDFHQGSRSRSRAVELIPKSLGQEQLILSLTDTTTVITVALGPAGTGKTYLAMQAAIRALRTGQIERLILSRPAVGVDDERHGFLPGDLVSKMEPWTRPLLDVLKEFYHPKDIAGMIDDQIIEISPLAFMRGRTFKNAWIIADEMQNATPNQMKMLLTRLGTNTRITVTGDVEQTDRQRPDNGLLDIATRLSQDPVKGISLVEMTNRDIQRHPIIGPVLDLYR